MMKNLSKFPKKNYFSADEYNGVGAGRLIRSLIQSLMPRQDLQYDPNYDPKKPNSGSPFIKKSSSFFKRFLLNLADPADELNKEIMFQQALFNSMTPATVQRGTMTQEALNKLAGEREKARLDLEFENKKKEEDYKRAGLAQDAQYAVANRQIPATSLPTGAPYIDDSTRGRALENMYGSNLQRGFLEGVPNAEAAATQSKFAKSVLDAKNPFAYDIGTSAARREIQENRTGEASAKVAEEGAQGSIFDARENARLGGSITKKKLEAEGNYLDTPEGIRALILSLGDKGIIHAGDSAFDRLRGQLYQGSSVERETKPGAVVARDKQGREIKGEPTVEYKTRPPRVSSLPNFIPNPNPQGTNSFPSPGMSLKPRTEDEELMELIRRLQATGGY